MKMFLNIQGQERQEITEMKLIDFSDIEIEAAFQKILKEIPEITGQFKLVHVNMQGLRRLFRRQYKLPRKLKKKLFGTRRMRAKTILNARK